MLSENFHEYFLLFWITLPVLLIPALIKNIAPYGRHSNSKWGKLVDNRMGWMLMEMVSPIIFAYLFLTGTTEKSSVMWFFFGLWMLHYFNRSIIFPLRIRTKGKKIPLFIVVLSIFFNSGNGYINGFYLGSLSEMYPESWWFSPQFVMGVILFFVGMYINWQSDSILINLRKPGEVGYKIPKGGLFRYVSCPNHLGEIIEWIGFAIMCWNLAAFSFALWTALNLIPRTLDHHRWYLKTFKDYPSDRKAVIPFVL